MRARWCLPGRSPGIPDMVTMPAASQFRFRSGWLHQNELRSSQFVLEQFLPIGDARQHTISHAGHSALDFGGHSLDGATRKDSDNMNKVIYRSGNSAAAAGGLSEDQVSQRHDHQCHSLLPVLDSRHSPRALPDSEVGTGLVLDLASPMSGVSVPSGFRVSTRASAIGDRSYFKQQLPRLSGVQGGP